METATITHKMNGDAGSPPCIFHRFRTNEDGSVLAESAFVIPMLIAMMFAVLTYATWFMQAHSIQQVTNDAARASLAGMTEAERLSLVQDSVEASLLERNGIEYENVAVSTSRDDQFYTVTLRYDVGGNALFKSSFVPLPSVTIARSATVELPTY